MPIHVVGDKWKPERLAECERTLSRKCELLDAAELAEGVQVIVYAPESHEREGTLHSDTRVSVFVRGEDTARMTAIVAQSSQLVSDILARHGAKES